MRKTAIWIVAVLIACLAIALIAPLYMPIPEPEGTQPPRQLADSDSLFIEIKEVEIHYKQRGDQEPVLILLHGFLANLDSWQPVMEPLATIGRVIAYDRPAFGLTERPLVWNGANPYAATTQVDMLIELMDQLGVEQAILVGHSAGGALAALAALEHPQRFQALILVDPAIYTQGGNLGLIRLLGAIPQIDRIAPLFIRRVQKWGLDFGRRAWHDPTKLTPEVLARYLRPLRAEHWDRGLWEFTKAAQSLDLVNRLDELKLPVLVITGDDDRIVPTDESMRLAGELPNADMVVIPNCGHVPQEECPEQFLQAVFDYLEGLE